MGITVGMPPRLVQSRWAPLYFVLSRLSRPTLSFKSPSRPSRPSYPLLSFLSPSYLSIFNFTISLKSIEWNNQLIKKLGKKLAIFNNDISLLLLNQDSAFKLYYNLLGEDIERLAKRLLLCRSVRLQARELLIDVFRSLGPKVFLLFTLVVSILKLSEIAPQIRLPKI